MIGDFTSFLTVFKSYQDVGPVIMTSLLLLNFVHCWKDLQLQPISTFSGCRSGTARSAGQRLKYGATGAPSYHLAIKVPRYLLEILAGHSKHYTS